MDEVKTGLRLAHVYGYLTGLKIRGVRVVKLGRILTRINPRRNS